LLLFVYDLKFFYCMLTVCKALHAWNHDTILY
jgi:hypothetical protein